MFFIPKSNYKKPSVILCFSIPSVTFRLLHNNLDRHHIMGEYEVILLTWTDTISWVISCKGDYLLGQTQFHDVSMILCESTNDLDKHTTPFRH